MSLTMISIFASLGLWAWSSISNADAREMEAQASLMDTFVIDYQDNKATAMMSMVAMVGVVVVIAYFTQDD